MISFCFNTQDKDKSCFIKWGEGDHITFPEILIVDETFKLKSES